MKKHLRERLSPTELLLHEIRFLKRQLKITQGAVGAQFAAIMWLLAI